MSLEIMEQAAREVLETTAGLGVLSARRPTGPEETFDGMVATISLVGSRGGTLVLYCRRLLATGLAAARRETIEGRHDMKTVLTVDDSKVVRSMVARHLQPYGCRIVEAADGREGVAAAREHRPDLILLDLTMPVMDGRQALGELRQDPACKTIPVIMLTAESGKDLVIEIARLGVTGYIVKPFQKETFEKEVSKVLGAPGVAAAPAGAPGAAAR